MGNTNHLTYRDVFYNWALLFSPAMFLGVNWITGILFLIYFILDWNRVNFIFPKYFIHESTSVWFYANIFFYFIAAAILKLSIDNLAKDSQALNLVENTTLFLVIIFSLLSIAYIIIDTRDNLDRFERTSEELKKDIYREGLVVVAVLLLIVAADIFSL